MPGDKQQAQAARGQQHEGARLGYDPVNPQHKGVGTGDDRRGGSRDWRVQPFDETHYGFKCYFDRRRRINSSATPPIASSVIAAGSGMEVTIIKLAGEDICW